MSLLYEKKSFCEKGTMSICVAKNNKEREMCEFYEDSRTKGKCMYFIFDEYCDCLKAQMDKERQRDD